MGRFIILPLLGLLTLGYATKCPQQRVSPGREILCYTSSLDIKVLENSICRCTTLVHQGHDLQDLGKTGLEDLRKSLKQLNHALQFVISINDARGILRTSADSRQEAIARIIGITNQVDGVELNVTAGSKERLVHFVQGLKKEMVRKSREKRIIMALPTKAEMLAKHYDIKELSKYVDLFSIPTHYLMDDKDNYRTFHPSRLMGLFDLLNTDSLVDLVHGLGAVKRKILVSLPASGYKFTLKIKDQNTPSSPAVNKTPIMLDRVQLCNEILQGEWTIERDEDLTAPYAFKNDSWIAFEDKISSKIKGKYILLRDLAGLGIRNIENDLPNDCGKTVTEDIYHSFTTNQRKSREAVLMSLEDDIYNPKVVYPNNLKSSDFRIARIVDTEGNIHAVRENTHTEFSCPKQGYYVHPKSCNRFYRCVKFNQQIEQYSIFEFDCPAGLAFDETTEVCVWPGSLPQGSACPGSPEIAPSAAKRFHCPGAGYYADPQNCRWFFACMDLGADKMMAYEFQCPYGLVFDEHKLACEWPWLVPKCVGTGYERKDYGNDKGHGGQGGYDGHGGQGGYDGHGGQGGYDGHGGQGEHDGTGQGGHDGHGGQGGYDGGYDNKEGGYDGHKGQGGYDGHGGQSGYDGQGGHGGQGGYDGLGGQGEHDGTGQGGHDGHGGQGGYDGGYDNKEGDYDGHKGQGGYDGHGGQGGYDGQGGHGGQSGYDGQGGHGGQGGYDGLEGQGEHDGTGQGGYDSHGGQGGHDNTGGQGGHDGTGQGGHDGTGQGGNDGHGGQGGYDGHGGQGGYDGHGGQGGYDGHKGQGGYDGHGGQGGYDGHGGQGGYDGQGGHGGQSGYDSHGGQGGHDSTGQGGYDGHGGQGGYDSHGGQGGHDSTGQGGYDSHGGQGGYDGHGGQGGHDGGYDNKEGGYDEHGVQVGNDGHGGHGGYDGGSDNKEGNSGHESGYDGLGGQGGSGGHEGKGGYDNHGGKEGGHDSHDEHKNHDDGSSKGGDEKYDGHGEHDGKTDYDNKDRGGYDGDKGQGHPGDYDKHEGNQGEHGGYDDKKGGNDDKYDHGNEGGHVGKDEPHGGHEDKGHDGSSKGGDKSYDDHTSGNEYGMKDTGHDQTGGVDHNQGGYDEKGHGGYDYPTPDSKHYDGQGSDDNYDKKEYPTEYDKHEGGSDVTGHGVTVKVTGHGSYDGSQDKKHEEDHTNKGSDGKDQGHDVEEGTKHPGYDYPIPGDHETTLGHEEKDINIHGGFGIKTTSGFSQSHPTSGGFTPSFESTGQDTSSILYSGYTPSHTSGYTSKVNSYTQYEGNHGHYPNTVTGFYATPAVEIGGKPSLTTSHDSTIYQGDSGRFTESSGTVLTSPHQSVSIVGGVTQPGLIHTHSGAANTAGYSINHGINTDYGKPTPPHFGVHGTSPASVIPNVYIQGHTATGLIPESKVTTGNGYYTNQAHGTYTDSYTTKNKIGYSFGSSSAVPGTQFYTKQIPESHSHGFTNKNEAGITFGGYSTPQENKYYTNQASLSFTGSIKSNEQGYTPSMSVTVTGNQYHPNQAGESFTSDKITKTSAIYTPISYTSSGKYPTNDIKTSISTSGYQKTPSQFGTTSSINYSGSGNRYYTNQAGYNTNIGFPTSSGSLFTPKQSITLTGNQYYTNQVGIPTPSGPEEVPITPVNDGSGYRTNEYHDNGGRGTIRYNNGVVTHKYTEDDIRDHRTAFTVFPTAEVTEASTFTPLNSGGVYTRGGFTKTGPTKTGITTAQVGGSGSYVAGGISTRPTAKPDEIGENAFGTGSKGIFGNIDSSSYSTPSSNIDGSYVIDHSKLTGTQSSVISSGYSYDIPENKLNIYSTDAPAPQAYSEASPPYLDIKVYNTKETTTPSPSINTQSHLITSNNLDELHATGFSRISGTQSSSLSSGHSYNKARNQFNTRPTVAPVSPQGHSSPFFDIQVYNTKGISAPSPTTTSPDAVNTHSYAKSTSSQYQETMYQSGKSSPAASTGEYFKPTPQRKYPTVSSTAQPVGYSTGPLDRYRTTLFDAAKIPVAISTVRPVFNVGHKTVVSTTEIPVPVEDANYDYKGNGFTGSIATKDESLLNVGANFEQPTGHGGPSAVGKVTSSVNYQYSTQSQDVADKYTESEEVGSLGYSLGNVDGGFGYKINKEGEKDTVDDHLTINIQPQGFKRPSTVLPLNKETYNRPIEIEGTYKDSSKSKESFDGYKYTKPTKEFNSSPVVAVKHSSTLSPSQSVTTSPHFNIGIYNNEVTKPETNYNRGNAKYTPSDEYDDTKYSSGLSKIKTYDYATTSRFREHDGVKININSQQKSEFTTPKSSVSEPSIFSPSIPSRRPSFEAQTRTSTYSPPVTTYSGNYKKSSMTPNYPVMTKSSQESISKGKGKVIVKLSDLHPVLLGKLSAECTCKADPFASFRGNKPLLIESNNGKVDLRNYDESDVYVDLENSKESNNYDEEVETAGYRTSTPSALISTHENPVVKFNGAVKSRRPASIYLPVASTPRPPSSTYLPSTTASSLLRVSASDIEASSHSSRAQSRSGKSLGSSRSNNLSKDKASDRSDFGEIGVLELNPEGRAECARPGLFRHPKHCNKFYACHWDDWKKKFTLHIFNCPIHLTFDSNAGACNWPSKGPACQDDNLLI